MISLEKLQNDPWILFCKKKPPKEENYLLPFSSDILKPKTVH